MTSNLMQRSLKTYVKLAEYGRHVLNVQKLGCERRLFQSLNSCSICSVRKKYTILFPSCNSVIFRKISPSQFLSKNQLGASSVVSFCSKTNTNASNEQEITENESKKKPSLFQRFKIMYKEYWYVLIPVHVATSVVWFGSFYYALRSGVDIVGILEQIGASETILKPLKNTSAGYFALSYAMYKIATPARYAVTLGGTTFSINYLRRVGVIKPIPSRDKMKKIWKEKKSEMKEKKDLAIENWKSKKHKS